jgi:DNA-binding LacI/PurR family transcriptional regulator
LRDELAQRGLPPAAAHLGEGYIFDGDRPATVQFCLEQVEAGVTALLIGDGSAPGVVEALEARGLRVPEDVSIIGCDGLGLTVGAAGLWLSSLDFDKPYVGELAARTILELHRARGRLASVTRMTAMRLVEGQTVGDAR